MMIQSTTNNHLSFISNHLAMVNIQKNNHLSIINNHLAFGIFTLVKNPLQINSFMQNKANLLDALMNVTSLITVEYENISNWTLGENKPNTNPIKANSKPIQSQFKANQSQFKANTNPIEPNFKRATYSLTGWAVLGRMAAKIAPVLA
jgi:hypothetical protein